MSIKDTNTFYDGIVTNNYYGDSIKPLISKWEEYKTIKNSLEFADFMDWLAEEF